MSTRNQRRHDRLFYSGYIDLSWTDSSGQVKYARAKCLDLSESGIRVDASQAIPLRTSVFLRAEKVRLSGAATVRHVSRQGARFILGLELSQAISEKTLEPTEVTRFAVTK